MAKAIIVIKSCEIVNGQAQIRYDFASDYTIPGTSDQLGMTDRVATVNMSSSTTQINSGIKTAALTMLTNAGFSTTGLTANDITIFGGAQ